MNIVRFENERKRKIEKINKKDLNNSFYDNNKNESFEQEFKIAQDTIELNSKKRKTQLTWKETLKIEENRIEEEQKKKELYERAVYNIQTKKVKLNIKKEIEK